MSKKNNNQTDATKQPVEKTGKSFSDFNNILNAKDTVSGKKVQTVIEEILKNSAKNAINSNASNLKGVQKSSNLIKNIDPKILQKVSGTKLPTALGVSKLNDFKSQEFLEDEENGDIEKRDLNYLEKSAENDEEKPELTRQEKIEKGLIEPDADDFLREQNNDPNGFKNNTKEGVLGKIKKAKNGVDNLRNVPQNINNQISKAKNSVQAVKNRIGSGVQKVGEFAKKVAEKPVNSAKVANEIAKKAAQVKKAAEVAKNTIQIAKKAQTVLKVVPIVLEFAIPILIVILVVVLILGLMFMLTSGVRHNEIQEQIGSDTYSQGGASLANINPQSGAVSDLELMGPILRQASLHTEGADLLDPSTEQVRARYAKAGDVNNRFQTNYARLSSLTIAGIANGLITGNQPYNKFNPFVDKQQETLKRAFESDKLEKEAEKQNNTDQEDGEKTQIPPKPALTARPYEPLESRSLTYPYTKYRPKGKDDELGENGLPVANRPLIGKEQAKIIQKYLKEEIAKTTGSAAMVVDKKGGVEDENTEKKPEEIENLTGFKTDEIKVFIDGMKVQIATDHDTFKPKGNAVKTYATSERKDEKIEFEDLSKEFGDFKISIGAPKELEKVTEVIEQGKKVTKVVKKIVNNPNQVEQDKPLPDKTGASDPRVSHIKPIRAATRTTVYETFGHPPIDLGETPEGVKSVLRTTDVNKDLGKSLEDLGYTSKDLTNETFGSYIDGKVRFGLLTKSTGSVGWFTSKIVDPVINWLLKMIFDWVQSYVMPTYSFPTYTNRFYQMENWKRKTLASLERFNPNNELYKPGTVHVAGQTKENVKNQNGGYYLHMQDRSALFDKWIQSLKRLFNIDLSSEVDYSGETSAEYKKMYEQSRKAPQPDIAIEDETKELPIADLERGRESLWEKFKKWFDDLINPVLDIFKVFDVKPDQKLPIYDGATVDDIIAQSMQDLRQMDLNRTVQGGVYEVRLNMIFKYRLQFAFPFFIPESFAPALAIRFNYAKKVISNGPNNEEILNYANAMQKAVLRAVVDEKWQNMENKDKRGYSEPINIANNGAFLFGKEQVDRYIKQLEIFRERVRKKDYTNKRAYSYGAVNDLRFTGASGARPWNYIEKYDKKYVEYLNSLGIRTKKDYYRAIIIAEMAAQGVRVSDQRYSSAEQNAENEYNKKLIQWALTVAETETGNFTRFRQLNPYPVCDGFSFTYRQGVDSCLPTLSSATQDLPDFILGTVKGMFDYFFGKPNSNGVPSHLSSTGSWNNKIFRDFGKKFASFFATITEAYGPIGKGMSETITSGIDQLLSGLKFLQNLELIGIKLRVSGATKDVILGMISDFNSFGRDDKYTIQQFTDEDGKKQEIMVKMPGSQLNQFIPDGETGLYYDGRGFLRNSFVGKRMYEKFGESYLAGVDLVKNPNLIAQNEEDLNNVSLAAFILARNVINKDINVISNDKIENINPNFTMQEYNNALKVMKGNSKETEFVKGGACVAVPFMGKVNNYLNTGVILKGNGDVVSYATGDVIFASFGQKSGTVVFKVEDPTGRSPVLLVRYSGLDPQFDPMGIRQKFDKAGRPRLESVRIRAGEVIGKTKDGSVKIDFLNGVLDNNGQVDLVNSSLINPLSDAVNYVNLDKYKMCDEASGDVGMSQYYEYDYNYFYDRTTPRVKREQQASFRF